MSGTHLVTGAGSGIGAATARALHERGDDLLLLARSAQRAEELAGDFPGAGTVVADLSRPGTLAEVVPGSLPARLDSVIHAAGVVEVVRVDEASPAVMDEALAVNLAGAAELTRLCLAALRQGQGQLVFVNSTAGLRANPGWSAYAASKFGLRGFADALREEERPHGVRVTSVYPGRTATPMQQKVHRQEGRDYHSEVWATPESVAASVLSALDTDRRSEVADVTVRPTGFFA